MRPALFGFVLLFTSLQACTDSLGTYLAERIYRTVQSLSMAELARCSAPHLFGTARLEYYGLQNMPGWMMPSAMSFGHVQVFGPGSYKNPDGPFALNRFGVPVVTEETLHTRQAEALGPFYLPRYRHGLIDFYRRWNAQQ